MSTIIHLLRIRIGTRRRSESVSPAQLFFALVPRCCRYVPRRRRCSWEQEQDSHRFSGGLRREPKTVQAPQPFGDLVPTGAGQVREPGPIDFIAGGNGYVAYLSAVDTTLLLRSGAATSLLHVRLAGARGEVPGVGRRELPGRTNHLTGNDPRQWRTAVRGYAQVEYRDVYPGITVVYYGDQQQLEYDFAVMPGANYRNITIDFRGADRVTIDGHGNLIVATPGGNLVQHAPVIYQEAADGTRRSIEGGYVIRKGHEVGFRVGTYDRRLPLVIDPVLTYSTFLGGTGGEYPYGLALDAHDNVYVTGITTSLDFPVVNGAPPAPGGYYFLDAFVAKLNASGDALVYATYLGGSGQDYASDIAVDSEGNAYVAGYTSSPDFPLVHAIDSTMEGGTDAFVTKLDPAGGILYSTLLGGRQQEIGNGIAVDAYGRAVVTGWTQSPDFPLVNARQSTLGGGAALRTVDGGTSWNAISTGLSSTWIRAFAIDPGNHATIYAAGNPDGLFKSTNGGDTWTAIHSNISNLSPSALAIAPTDPVTLYAGFDDAVNGVFRSTDEGVSWTQVLPSTGLVMAVAVDPQSPTTIYAAVVPGFNTIGVFKSTDGGGTWVDTYLNDAPMFLAVSGSTVYAGSGWSVYRNTAGAGWTPATNGLTGQILALAVDPANASVVYAATVDGVFKTVSGGDEWHAVVTGGLFSAVALAPSDPRTVYAADETGIIVTTDGGDTWRRVAHNRTWVSPLLVDPETPTRAYAGSIVMPDAFVSVFSPDGSALQYSTFIGGGRADTGNDVTVDSQGDIYVVGTTNSNDFPVANGAQMTLGGFQDAFVMKLTAGGGVAYSTYIGGTDFEDARTIAVDADGQAHIAGYTFSSDFPVANAHQASNAGGYDVFVTKVNSGGDGFVYSTFLGGSAHDYDPAIAVAPSGEAFVTGNTASANFPTLNALQSTLRGYSDGFVAKYSPDGRLAYSTLLGGGDSDAGVRVAIDSSGAAVIAGSTSSSDFPVRNAFQPAMAGGNDIFMARLADSVPDTIAPTTAIALTGTPGLAGWYRSNVSVTLSATDNAGGSGVAFITSSVNGSAFQPYVAPFEISLEGATQVRGRAQDSAGNLEEPGASVNITIDVTAPDVRVASPQARAYPHSDALTVGFSASDSVSGIAGGSPSAMLDGSVVANGQTISLLTLTLGQHTLDTSASDVAGNSARQSVPFTVIATIDSLIATVNALAAQGKIEASVQKTLLAKLSDAKQAISRGNLAAARNKLLDVIDYLNTKRGHGIADDAATLLVADAEYVVRSL